MTELPFNPRDTREKLTQLIFEKFHVLGFQLSITGILALFASGQTSGIVVDSGASQTHVISALDGYCLPQNCFRLDIGGRDLDAYMVRQLTQDRKLTLSSSKGGVAADAFADEQIARDIKEKLCYVSDSYESELKEMRDRKNGEKKYKLPDGREIDVGVERIRTAEVLFQPSLIGKAGQMGIDALIIETVKSRDVDVRKECYSKIALCGGTTNFTSIGQRLKQSLAPQIAALLPQPVASPPFTLLAPTERAYSAWIGGAVLSSLSSFESGSWVFKKEYEEHGASIINKKCF